MLESMINRFLLRPRNLFLLDGLGALLSAFLLGVVLVRLENLFGIPRTSLYFLAALPCLFALYDGYCYQKRNINFIASLKGIALLNITYCFISVGFLFYHYQQVTPLGWVYILSEVGIILALVWLELRTASQLKNNGLSENS